MATLRILIPDGTVNYVKNPAMRYDTTGWAATGSSISRSLDYARFNIASLKVVTSGIVIGEGCYYRISWLNGISDVINGSVYLRGSGIVRVRLVESGTWVSGDIKLSPTRWTRVEVQAATGGSNDFRIYIETASRAQSATFYVDGAQVERKPYSTTYCDGDQPGCYWNVMAHNSVSQRDSDTRLGGRWVSLIGCDRSEKNLYFTVIGGLGVAPIRNDTQPFADAPGSYYQSTKILDRIVTITFYVKNSAKQTILQSSLKDLHRLRQMLWDILKPDLTASGEEFLIEYQDGFLPVYFRARYDGGMDGEWDVRNHFVNSFPLRLLVVSPFLSEDDQEVSQLQFGYNQTVNRIIRRFDGTWAEMNGGFDGNVLDLQIGSKGEVIAAGQFIHANNKATATHPMIFANYIAYWDGIEWQQYGIGANNVIRAVAVAPNGDLYVTGDFTSIGGVACNRIAHWVAATSTWQAMSTGLNASGYAIAVSPLGNVYVGGAFTTAGGVAAKYIARWDGSSFQTLGAQGGLNNIVYALAISSDGTQVFAGGAFTDEFGSPGILALNYVGLYYSASNDWWEIGDGFNSTVLALCYAPSGRIYAAGQFTEAGNATGQVLLYIAYSNGIQWFDMNAGADNIVRALDVASDGQVLAVGDFTRIGGVDAVYAALWNGSVWVNLDIGTGAVGYAGIFDQKGNIYLGTGTTIDLSSINSILNIGTAEVNPILYILGPVTLKWIENQTSRKRLYADLDILTNEEVFIDFAHGKAVSTVRGDLAWAILPGSDFRSWKLLPGANKIIALMINGTGTKAQISYVPRHWSADATQGVDAF